MFRRFLVHGGVWCVAAVLAGCVAAPESSRKGVDAPAEQRVAPPRVENRTPFPHLTLTGVDKFGEYTSLALKMSYHIDEQGQLQLQRGDQEPLIDEHTPLEDDYRCQPHGAGFNQRTTWFPDTGIFVQGATLTQLADARGQRKPLLPMVAGDRGEVAVTGPQARELEYAYVPCVGPRRASAPVRTVGYVAPGDRLTLRPAPTGRAQRRPASVVLTLPQDFRPVLLLDFADRTQRAVVPARIVVFTVDWPARRAVAQYQATVAMQPQVESATWTMTLPPEMVSDDPGMQQVNDAIRGYIKTCSPPTKPMDPCANPHGDLPAVLRR